MEEEMGEGAVLGAVELFIGGPAASETRSVGRRGARATDGGKGGRGAGLGRDGRVRTLTVT